MLITNPVRASKDIYLYRSGQNILSLLGGGGGGVPPLIKKEDSILLIYKEIQNGSVQRHTVKRPKFDILFGENIFFLQNLFR